MFKYASEMFTLLDAWFLFGLLCFVVFCFLFCLSSVWFGLSLLLSVCWSVDSVWSGLGWLVCFFVL